MGVTKLSCNFNGLWVAICVEGWHMDLLGSYKIKVVTANGVVAICEEGWHLEEIRINSCLFFSFIYGNNELYACHCENWSK